MSPTTKDRRGAPARSGTATRAARPPAPGKRAAERPASRARTQGRAPRIPFVLLVLSLLGGALVGLLLLRSVIAEEAFTITSLQSQNRELSYEEQRLRSSVSHLESSERIAQEAEAMGMEQGEAPLFLDPDRGRVSGDAGSDG
ncbi:hypothetical protein [Nocardiopsis algeriensis]|uniref:Cell division protein FtsL n=1 Tax=Nocardiopsis algeriensis TaxID=1478215 RepID=A0A841IRY6_9ACTN|nr:hypothetical protein [Nocardiopsis algeriensis]MBB6121447.1 hypothetical protein [Nocardiopsis algeriensis]